VRLPVAVVVTAAGALAAAMTGRPEAALLAAPWVALLALGLVPRSGGRSVEVSVNATVDRVLVGDEVQLRITTVADGDGSLRVEPSPSALWEPAVEPTGAPGSLAIGGAVEVVAAGRPTTMICTLTARRWGRHDIGRVELLFREPYGLLEWAGATTRPIPVAVHPPARVLDRLVAPRLVRRLPGVHPSSALGRGLEHADVRPFGAGDSRRDVNQWVTARTGEPWVTRRHADRMTEVILLLDSFVESGHDVRAAVGLAVEAATALAESHLARADRVGLVELGGILRWTVPGMGRLQRQRLIDALLGTRLYSNATYRVLDGIPPRALPPRSLVVALSPLLDDRFVHSLIVLRGAGHDVAVIECEPVFTDRRAGSGEAGERAAVGRRLWEAERAVTRQRLAERGVAIARWRSDQPLDGVLAELTIQRSRVGRSVAGRWALARTGPGAGQIP
jgi:uncharacterized protein (DUF58 family)